MNLEIINQHLSFDLFGYSGVALHKDYVGTAFALMNRMWQTLRETGLKNKGINIWVYEPDEKVFAGVELIDTPPGDFPLEKKTLTLTKYAYYKHIGPYHLIKDTCVMMGNELHQQGFETLLPFVEIYGHWTNDESKLETEILMSIR